MKNNKGKFQGRNNGARLKVKGGKKFEKKSKKEFDPNRPRRPPSPFFIFLDEFRREFNKAHPDNKSVSVVGKAAGKKWKNMTQEEKEPFAAIARSKKTEFAMNIQEYNMKLAEGTNTTGDDESDKPKSEVNDHKVNNEEKGGSEEAEGTNTTTNNETKATGDNESDKPKSEVNDDEEESGSEEEEGDDKEVAP